VNKIKAILVDDEARARNVLKSLLERNCPEVELLASCEDVISAAEQIKRLNPDVVFLDIQMPDYNGYELMQFVPNINFEIIFVTAYDQYALKAFELCAIDYLLKPIKRERLKDAVQKVGDKLKNVKIYDNYKELVESFQEKKISQIVISSTEGKNVVKFDNLIAIEGQGAYSTIYLANNTTIFTSKNLKYFQDALEVDNRFFRCHKSWIVNTDLVTNTDNTNCILTMQTGLEIKVSKLKRTELAKLLVEN